ncbi:MAG: 3-phosphoshikimate 1-carboxyvinyltransferase [Firmicutes bacterium]|nr:3-phosphoshikimate 1-carboxyvinyltransferase [Bacillota bacterium]MCL5038312.1 3-phosphoshikimate 1-carboxyvinyltransferase [Bacillota bacterium]
MEAVIQPAERIRGTIRVPGDKSISHRAVILGAVSEGETEIKGFLRADDCLSTIRLFHQMGVRIEGEGTDLTVHGVGLRGLQEPAEVLDVGNSGTTIRLVAGLLSGQSFFSVLTGDASIRRRPMGRITQPLQIMGARVFGRQGGTLAPLAIAGGSLRAAEHVLPVASAQVKSALLLAGLLAAGETSVEEPALSRDHTERLLAYLGGRLRREGNRVFIAGGQRLWARPLWIPGDISSAAFFLVAAALVPGSDLVVENLGLNPTRSGILEVLAAMGADLEVRGEELVSGEPVGTIRIRHSRLRGIRIGGSLIPRLIDELPVLAVAAALAQGETIIEDAQELRVKESDRISAIAQGLTALGAKVSPKEDGLIIQGVEHLRGARVEAFGDHRIAMALAVAGLAAQEETILQGAEAVSISYPDFFPTLSRVAQ